MPPAFPRPLAVLTDVAVAVAHVAPEFLGLPQSGCMAVAERKEQFKIVKRDNIK